eukprot:TRINITY_DN1707_c0_g2_i4.p1 TRINITY_DN1707_c0_g2~~TRINITY_DN1707_c0_g2_i4.p1  ORF type:complete len:867 (+),score=300.47 TRINITY_DN1707_c0_g2_i4:124-2724(+)
MADQNPKSMWDTNFFRSEEMEYLMLSVPKDAATLSLHRLGQLQFFHMTDLNAGQGDAGSIQLEAKKRSMTAASWDRRIHFLEDKMKEFNVVVPPFDPDHLLRDEREMFPDVLVEVKGWLEPLEQRLIMDLNFKKENDRDINDLEEQRHLLTLCRNVMKEREEIQDQLIHEEEDGERKMPLLRNDLEMKQPADLKLLKAVACVVPEDRFPAFERMLWRISRGKVFVRSAIIPEQMREKDSGELITKRAVLVFFLGGHLNKKLNIVVESFQGSRYEIPENLDAQMQNLVTSIDQKRQVSARTEASVRQVLQQAAWDPLIRRSPLRNWEILVKKEIALCEAMRKCKFGKSFLHIEGWCPARRTTQLALELKRLIQGSMGLSGLVIKSIQTDQAPPTYFDTNKFTSSFQGIVDTYGVPRYREVNPGLFTIVTFPFLFGVMYGDIGHSAALTLFALYLVINEKGLIAQQKRGQLGELVGMMFAGRYLLLLMGVFAFYVGWIYNDFVSVAIDAFGSCYSYPNANATMALRNQCGGDGVYPLGVDPIWHGTVTELTFYNSLKMKLSVILGVTHMTFGVILSLWNKVHFGDWLGVIFEFIPQLLFMLCLFGYLVFLIILKWCTDFSNRKAPNLIQTMMGMVLSLGAVNSEDQLYAGQSQIQLILLVVAVLCVPVMLLAKPLLRHYCFAPPHVPVAAPPHPPQPPSPQYQPLAAEGKEEKDEPDEHSRLLSRSPPHYSHEKAAAAQEHHQQHEQHGLGEEMIHQGIHTIEYVLGTVSNTASYLRLWALSLAHSELASVFWERLFMMGIKSGNPVGILVGFAAWAAITTGVLLLMDVLECFLHALRLHWVEFQNKFYFADGYPFEPFTLKLAYVAE